MDDALFDGGIRWQRSGRLRLRALTRADLAALAGAGVGGDAERAHTFETWPKAALADALIRHYPDLQIAVELDQRVVGGLLARPQPVAPVAVMHPWSLRELSTLPGEPLSVRVSDEIDAATQALRGVGAVWLGEVNGPQIQKALRLGRQLLVQQRGCEATFSVVRALGWERRKEWSAPAYLQQVHARAIEDARLSAYLDAGYMMRGYWQVGEAIDVVMRWAYRAH